MYFWTSLQTSCRWVVWRSPSASSWTPPLSWSKTVTAISLNPRQHRWRVDRTGPHKVFYWRCQAGWSGFVLFPSDHCSFFSSGLFSGSSGGSDVPPPRLDEDFSCGLFVFLAITLVPMLMPMLIKGTTAARRAQSGFRLTQAMYLPILRSACVIGNYSGFQLRFLVVTLSCWAEIGSQFMPPLFEGSALYMPTAPARESQLDRRHRFWASRTGFSALP